MLNPLLGKMLFKNSLRDTLALIWSIWPLPTVDHDYLWVQTLPQVLVDSADQQVVGGLRTAPWVSTIKVVGTLILVLGVFLFILTLVSIILICHSRICRLFVCRLQRWADSNVTLVLEDAHITKLEMSPKLKCHPT